MLGIILILVFTATVAFVLGVFPLAHIERPKLQALDHRQNLAKTRTRRFAFLRSFALVNKPLCLGPLGRRMAKDLAVAQIDMAPEELMLIKEALIAVLLIGTFPLIQPDMLFFWAAMGFAVGYIIPDFMVQRKGKRIKNDIIKHLPDTIDLLGLCVNAGLDFMLALKWVVEKSPRTALIDELHLVMQEINVGKTRRTALSDLAQKYELPDLSTFSRTLIQSDRMGTSVAEALNILSEDMRLARFRRGEQIALKAPLKMLIPLLLFIFPVVAILVGAPIFLDFMQNNPMQQISGGIGGGR